MSYPDSFELNFGNDVLTFQYVIDPETPPTDYSYILHRDGRVDTHDRINTTGLNRVSLHRIVMSQITFDELNPPLVVYVKMGSGDRI
jgi:hypothetical protein